jgi:RsiW-degrading membrane proteinase PrsW (M82 family)
VPLILAASLGAVPGLAWLLYVYFTDRGDANRFPDALKVFVWGCGCTVPAFVLESVTGATVVRPDLAPDYTQSAINCFLLIAPIEEGAKMAAVWGAVYRSPSFRSPSQGLFFAATAALGFASVENVYYMYCLGPEVLLLRLLFATPAHVLYSSFWGYSMGVARFQREEELITTAKGFGLSTLMHGGYNMLVAIRPGMGLGVAALLPLMALMVWLTARRVKTFREHYPYPEISEGPLTRCPTCGAFTPESEPACVRCGLSLQNSADYVERYCRRCRSPLEPDNPKCSRCGAPIHAAGNQTPTER